MKHTYLRPIAWIFLLVILPFLSQAQEKYTLSGYVKEASSGEDMGGATIVVPANGAGTYSNTYGFYSLTLPEGEYEVEYRFLGYKTIKKTVKLTGKVTVTVELEEEGTTMDDVVITADKDDENVTGMEMSTVTVDVMKAKKMPALFGEVDIIKTIQLMPGVSTVGEGLSGYYVRGGQTDHNLILLDEATVFNASHVLGFFSVFNADALKSEVKLYKGGIPAMYGGRLASALVLRMREGNMKKYQVKGGLGILSSRLTVEGPLKKNKGSFIVSGRRTYADLFSFLARDPQARDAVAYFYDINAKVNWKFSEKDRIFLSGYFGRDVLKFAESFGNSWGNGTGSLRWNHLFSEKLFANTTAIFSDFNYGFNVNFNPTIDVEYEAGIRDYQLKTDFNLFLNPQNQLKFGYSAILHQFNPGQFKPVGESPLIAVEIDPDYALETGIYLSNEQKLSSRVSIDYGLRYSMFDQLGPATEYDFDDEGNITDSTTYSTLQVVKHYGGWEGFEPRLSARIITDESSSIKVSYNRMRQYLHLASNSTASFPWDIWIPSNRHIKPQLADQVAVGYFRNFWDNRIEASVELYYKHMQNQIDFVEGADLLLNQTIETEILAGTGWAYGAEFFLQKKIGRWTGWIGYTLSWSFRNVPGINNDKTYRARNDRRHDISVVAMFDASKRVTVSGTFVYYTGNAATFPSQKYVVDGQVVNYYGDRNSSRMPAFHRLDFAADIKLNKNYDKRFQHSLNISLYNAYGRKNAFSLDFRPTDRDTDEGAVVSEVWKTYLFRWVPSVTWNFEF